MLLTYEQLQARLSNPRNSAKENTSPGLDIRRKVESERFELKTLRQGRKNGDLNYPSETRIEVGALSRTIGPTRAAEVSGMTQSNASYLGRAYSSNLKRSQSLNQAIEERVSSKIATAQDQALDKLIASISHIDEEKLGKLKAKELVKVATGLSTVVNKVSPNSNGSNSGFRVIINTVDRKDDEDYQTIEVSM